jgi:hypothetical protein
MCIFWKTRVGLLFGVVLVLAGAVLGGGFACGQ